MAIIKIWSKKCRIIDFTQLQIDTTVWNPTSDLDIINDFDQFNQNCFG